jgi:hypothetical protein
MPQRFTFRGISTSVQLPELVGQDSRLRRLRGLLARTRSADAADAEAAALARAALQAAGDDWVDGHHACVREVLASWDELAQAWRAGRDRAEIEPRLAGLPDALVGCLSMVPDAESQVRAAMRVGLLHDLVCRLPAARPRREDLDDLGRRLRAGLEVAFVARLADPDALDAILERQLAPRLAALAAEAPRADADPEGEPCGWCEVGEERLPEVLGGAGLRVVGTWACPAPKSQEERRHRAVEGLAVAPRQGIGLWGPWAPTVRNLEARGTVCELDAEAGCGCAALSPDGRRAAAGGWGFVAWDLGSKRVLLAEDELDEPLHALLFHPDGERLYSGGDDGRVRCWDLHGGGVGWVADCGAPVRGLALARRRPHPRRRGRRLPAGRRPGGVGERGRHRAAVVLRDGGGAGAPGPRRRARLPDQRGHRRRPAPVGGHLGRLGGRGPGRAVSGAGRAAAPSSPYSTPVASIRMSAAPRAKR